MNVRELLISCCCITWLAGVSWSQDAGDVQWWRGNLHTHSLWSDGDDFPEMITKWYVEHDYHFLALTDHNVLSQGERWMDLSKIEERGGKVALEKYLSAFGQDWVEIREKQLPAEKPKKDDDAKPAPSGQNEATDQGNPGEPIPGRTIKQVRLKGLAEFRETFETPGTFLMIAAEEISDRSEGVPVHMNATNLQSVISPVGGKTVREAINNNLRAAAEQAAKNGEPILVHLNHPNFGWAVTAEDLAAITDEHFFEVYNGHPGVNHLGDATRPGVEKMWDIANTIRIDQIKSKPMLGLATDDSHYYHGRPGSHTGRGWVMVQSSQLKASSLIEAMNNGDFYASSGVTLTEVKYDRSQQKLSLTIQPQDGVTYSTRFIGTVASYDKQSVVQLDANGKPIRATKLYSDDVGAVLAESDSLTPEYQLTGDELYVRAVVTSSQDHPDPSFQNQKEQAWTQPVGWESRIR